jgi:hypothetical protein
MPSEAENEFYTQHQAEINKLAREENKRRREAGAKQLTPEEGQAVIADLMQFLKQNPGSKISDYQIDIPYSDQDTEEESESQVRPNVKAAVESPGQINCYFVPCENGYLAKIGARNYIFKTEKELIRIVKPILFKETPNE